MSALRILFNLYPGEASRSKLFVLLGLLWSFGGYGIFTLSEGAFLEYVGTAALPLCYVSIAVGLCLLSTILLSLLNRLPIHRFLGGMFALWSVVLFSFYSLYTLSALTLSPTFWLAFRIMGWIIPISSYICFWSFIDQYFDLQDGKRFFSFFNSFLLLGDFLAAGVISCFVQRIGMGPLMLLFGAALLSALPLVLMISRTTPPILDEHVDHMDSPPPSTIKQTLNILVSSRFTLLLLLFYLGMQLVHIVTEYNYMDAFQCAFQNTSDHNLTAFVGRCSMWISFGNMLLGFLIYGRLVKQMGINNIILIAPTLFLLLSSLWLWKQGIYIAIGGMAAREGMSYVMDDNNLNLLLTGVPTKIKNQIRITVESFFEPAGMLLSALLLFCFHQHSLILGMLVTSIACVIVLFLRHYYPKAIFLNLIARSIRFGKGAVDWIQKGERKEVEFRLLSHLKSTHEASQLLAFEYLLILEEPRLLRHLLNHINQLSLSGKIKAIELLSDSFAATETMVVERLERLRRLLPYPSIRSVIHFYFARHGLLRPERILHDLSSDSLGLRSAAILTLKSSPLAEQLPSFRQCAVEKLSELLEGNEEEVCAGLHIIGAEGCPESATLLLPFLKHHSLSVKRACAIALKRVAHPDQSKYGVTLASRLCYTHDPKTRGYCLEAIANYQNPDAIIPLITSSIHFRPRERMMVEAFALEHGKELQHQFLTLLCHTSKHERCRLLAGKILAKLNPKLLRGQIHPIVKEEVQRAYHHFFHASTIQRHTPSHDLSLLVNALMTNYHAVVDFIVQLIGAANEIDDCEVLTMSLRSTNKKIRAQAIESLEKTASPRLFQLLLPLINEDEATKIHLFFQTGGRPLSLSQLLDQMATSASPTDRIVSAGLRTRLHIRTPEETENNVLIEQLVSI